MTAINIIKQRDAVHMITDGASWQFGGTFLTTACKAWPLPPGDGAIQKAALAAMPAEVRSVDDMDPARDGLAMIQAQRTASPVGAFVQLTTVTRDGISTRIIHSWPEEWAAPMIPGPKGGA